MQRRALRLERNWTVAAEAKAWAAHERQRMDREVAELAAELDAKAAARAKAARPIKIRTFSIE
jgi:hypothetical protein